MIKKGLEKGSIRTMMQSPRTQNFNVAVNYFFQPLFTLFNHLPGVVPYPKPVSTEPGPAGVRLRRDGSALGCLRARRQNPEYDITGRPQTYYYKHASAEDH